MALTVAELARTKMATRRLVVATVTFDSSYATGGEAFTAASVGLNALDGVLLSMAGGYTAEYVASTNKIKVYTPTNAAATHTHTGAAHLHTTGATASYVQGENSGSTTPGAGSASGAVTAAAGAEVANATNLATLVFTAICIGS